MFDKNVNNPNIATSSPIWNANALADLDRFSSLLTQLHRGGTYSYYWTPNGTNGRKESVWFPVGTGKLPTSWQQSKNVYFGLHPSNERRNRQQRSIKSGIAAINCLYAEFDGKDETHPSEAAIQAHLHRLIANGKRQSDATYREALGLAKMDEFLSARLKYTDMALQRILALPVRPSVVIFSGGGYQCYWLLKDTLSFDGDAAHLRRWAETIQARWVAFVGADPGAKDLTRILRVPGTRNLKPHYGPDFPKVGFIWAEFDRQYDLPDLILAMPATAYPEPTERTNRTHTPNTTIHDAEANPGLSDGAAGRLSRYAYTVLAAYNDQHDITSTLEDYGYTNAGNRRLIRPGGTSASVQINGDNRSYHYSSSDPLYGPHTQSPFDVVAILDYAGDYERASLAIGPGLGLYAPAVFNALREHILSYDIGRYVPDELKRRRVTIRDVDADGVITYREEWVTRYCTRSTDMKILFRILEIMAGAGKGRLTINAYQIVRATNTDGHTVQLASHKTVCAVLARHGWLFDAQPTDKPNTWLITLKIDMSRFPVTNELTSPVTGNLLTTTFSHWKADDQFAGGTSRYVRNQIQMQVKADDPQVVKDAIEQLPAGLQAAGILVVDTMIKAGGSGATVGEIADDHGLAPSLVASIIRKLRGMGLVHSERRYMLSSLHFIEPDAFKQLHDRRHEMRTYNGNLCRYERTLEKAQNALQKRRTGFAEIGEDTTRIDAKITRIAERRRPALAILYPELSTCELTKWLYNAYVPAPGVKAPVMPTPGHLAAAQRKQGGDEMSIYDAYAELAAAEQRGEVVEVISDWVNPRWDLTDLTRKLHHSEQSQILV